MTQKPKARSLLVTTLPLVIGIIVFIATFFLAWGSLGFSFAVSGSEILGRVMNNLLAIASSASLIMAGLILVFFSLPKDQKALAIKAMGIILSGGLVFGAPYINWLLEGYLHLPWFYAVMLSLVMLMIGIVLLARLIKSEEKTRD